MFDETNMTEVISGEEELVLRFVYSGSGSRRERYDMGKRVEVERFSSCAREIGSFCETSPKRRSGKPGFFDVGSDNKTA